MSRITALIFLSLAGLLAVARSADVSTRIELNADRDQYRMRIQNQAGAETYFDKWAFSDGLPKAPEGSRVMVRDRVDRPIYWVHTDGIDRGYSPNDARSTVIFDRKPEWQILPAGETYLSPWFSLADLMRGLDQVARRDSKPWKDFKLVFFLNFKDETSHREVRTEWMPFSSLPEGLR